MASQSTCGLADYNAHGPSPPPHQADYNPGHHSAPAMHPHAHDLNQERVGLLGNQNTMYGTIGRTLFVTRHKYWSLAPSYKTLGLAASFLLLSFLAGYFSNEAINANLHDMIRHKWALEESGHAITREAWAAESRKHEEIRLKIHHEIIMLEDRRAEHARRADEERQEEARRKQAEREEKARQRDGMTWAGLEPNHCVRYGVKEYTATLTHVPLGFNAIEECQKKSIEIQGRQWFPSLCEDQGICGRVTAHWQVDANEAMCTPWWGAIADKGCVESGIRRHEARLWNIQDTTNWDALCSTTPAKINGVHYDGPTSCTPWGWSGVWGIWLVGDDTCR